MVFTGEALAALDSGAFSWSPNFKTRDARSAIIRNAEKHGLPLADKTRDPRWSDVRALTATMATEPGVRLLACPFWSNLLGMESVPGGSANGPRRRAGQTPDRSTNGYRGLLMSEWTEWKPVEPYEFKHILYEKRHRTRGGGVARILLNRPERMNAFTPETSAEVIEALTNANRDKSIGVIVLSHVGQHFGVGGDVQELSRSSSSEGIGGITPDTIIKRCLKPVIAAVKGYVVGMHNHMAYHCDFTIAGESAIFGQNGPRVASPASGYLVASSAHTLGMKRAKELWMRCRQLTAQEALERGLCNVVVQDRFIEAEVEKWCDEILDLVPICIAAVKQSFEAVDAPLQYSDNFLTLIETDFQSRPEGREAQAAFFERRPPNFWKEEMMANRF